MFCIFNEMLILGDRQEVARHTATVKTTLSRLKLIDDTAPRRPNPLPRRLSLASFSISVSCPTPSLSPISYLPPFPCFTLCLFLALSLVLFSLFLARVWLPCLFLSHCPSLSPCLSPFMLYPVVSSSPVPLSFGLFCPRFCFTSLPFSACRLILNIPSRVLFWLRPHPLVYRLSSIPLCPSFPGCVLVPLYHSPCLDVSLSSRLPTPSLILWFFIITFFHVSQCLFFVFHHLAPFLCCALCEAASVSLLVLPILFLLASPASHTLLPPPYPLLLSSCLCRAVFSITRHCLAASFGVCCPLFPRLSSFSISFFFHPHSLLSALFFSLLIFFESLIKASQRNVRRVTKRKTKKVNCNRLKY